MSRIVRLALLPLIVLVVFINSEVFAQDELTTGAENYLIVPSVVIEPWDSRTSKTPVLISATTLFPKQQPFFQETFVLKSEALSSTVTVPKSATKLIISARSDLPEQDLFPRLFVLADTKQEPTSGTILLSAYIQSNAFQDYSAAVPQSLRGQAFQLRFQSTVTNYSAPLYDLFINSLSFE